MLEFSTDGLNYLSTIQNIIIMETWQDSGNMYEIFPNQNKFKITTMTCDFENDILVTGDIKGNVLVQSISSKSILSEFSLVYLFN